MSSSGPTPASPLWEDVDEPIVTLDPETPDYPVDVVLAGNRYGFTPEEAIDLADQLARAAARARGLDSELDQ